MEEEEEEEGGRMKVRGSMTEVFGRHGLALLHASSLHGWAPPLDALVRTRPWKGLGPVLKGGDGSVFWPRATAGKAPRRTNKQA